MDLFKRHIKHNILFMLLSFSIFSFSQKTMEKVLVEVGTATWSSASANEVNIINQMIDNGLQVCVLNYHLNDPYANQHANQRASYYNIQNLPHPIVGGEPATPEDYDSYLELYNQSINSPSSFVISSTGYFIEDTLFANIIIEKTAAYESDKIKLHISLSESNISQNWFSQTEVDDVERIMSPDGNGYYLDFSSTNEINITRKIIVQENWNPAEMELIAFIQNDTSRVVLQCHSQDFQNFAPLPVQAYFSVEDTIVCAKQLINLQNLSTGDIENSYWLFPGAIPDESDDFSPIIRYMDNGIFDVRLIVSNSISTDTLLVSDYLHIHSLPNLSFSSLPDFCHDDIFYQLVQASPEGGEYFGSYVDTGYFHPEDAAIGTHIINYTYTDELNGCIDTISQDAHVYLCESVPSLQSGLQSFPFNIYQNGNELTLKSISDKTPIITEIQAFNMSGQLIANKFFNPQSHSYNLFLNRNNHLIILRVHTEKKIFVIKHKL